MKKEREKYMLKIYKNYIYKKYIILIKEEREAARRVLLL
jgi:hypothetical protein